MRIRKEEYIFISISKILHIYIPVINFLLHFARLICFFFVFVFVRIKFVYKHFLGNLWEKSAVLFESCAVTMFLLQSVDAQ